MTAPSGYKMRSNNFPAVNKKLPTYRQPCGNKLHVHCRISMATYNIDHWNARRGYAVESWQVKDSNRQIFFHLKMAGYVQAMLLRECPSLSAKLSDLTHTKIDMIIIKGLFSFDFQPKSHCRYIITWQYHVTARLTSSTYKDRGSVYLWTSRISTPH